MIHDTPQLPLTHQIRKILDDMDRLRVHIDAALSYADGTHNFDDVVAMVMRGQLRLWALPNSVMLTEVVDFPRERHYHMFLGGGDLEEILAMHPQVEKAALEADCVKLSVTGRRGWTKALVKHGWVEKHTTVQKTLSKGQ